MRQSENPDLTKVVFLAGFMALVGVGLAAIVSGIVGGMEPVRPANLANEVKAGHNTTANPDVTFYVMAYHWDWAIFTEDGARLDTITVPQGATLEIFAVNHLAQNAINRLPAPVAKAMGEVSRPDAEIILRSEPDWIEPVLDHGFLLDRYGVIEYLAHDAQEPNRVVFTANIPGEYQFVCTNFCGAGHIHMTMKVRLVVQPVGLPVTN